jgi:hypothetical protein
MHGIFPSRQVSAMALDFYFEIDRIFSSLNMVGRPISLNRIFPEALGKLCVAAVKMLEVQTGKSFGGYDRRMPPLLLSVRGFAPTEDFWS